MFTQPDTLIQNIYDPQALNRYSFEKNNPLRYTDPTGHAITGLEWFFIIVGAISGTMILIDVIFYGGEHPAKGIDDDTTIASDEKYNMDEKELEEWNEQKKKEDKKQHNAFFDDRNKGQDTQVPDYSSSGGGGFVRYTSKNEGDSSKDSDNQGNNGGSGGNSGGGSSGGNQDPSPVCSTFCVGIGKNKQCFLVCVG